MLTRTGILRRIYSPRDLEGSGLGHPAHAAESPEPITAPADEQLVAHRSADVMAPGLGATRPNNCLIELSEELLRENMAFTGSG